MLDDKMSRAGRAVVLTAAVCILLLAAPWTGYVLSVLWAWFIVPTFNAPALGIVPAMGIVLVVNFVTRGHARSAEMKKHSGVGEAIGAMIGRALFEPALALGAGWIVAQFM